MFTAKLRGRYRDFSYTPLALLPASPIIIIPHQSGVFVTTDEPTLTHHNHPESTVYIRVHSWCVHSMGLDKCIIAGIHLYNIVQSSFTALKILCTPLIHPSCLNPWQVLNSSSFSEMSHSWNHTVCSLFRLASVT